MRLTVPGVPDLSAERAALIRAVEARVGRVLSDHAYHPVEPPILELAEPFIETSGEDIRRRLYAFTDPSGVELCLRPDLTVPTCRVYLRQIQTGTARLSAIGPAFRHQDSQSIRPRQFEQIDAELLDAPDPVPADAEILALAVQSTSVLGLDAAPIRFGDLGLFSALMTKLDISPRSQTRIKRSLHTESGLDAILDPSSDEVPRQSLVDTFARTLAQAGPGGARALVADVIALSGIQPVGGRGVDEICDRLTAQALAREANGTAISSQAAAIIRAYLALGGPALAILPALETLLAPLAIDLTAFRQRLDLWAKAGIAMDRLHFAGNLARAIDYYTGLVFEIGTPDSPTGPIAAGGRYDGLLARLGSGRDIPAIGFALWPDRALDAGGNP